MTRLGPFGCCTMLHVRVQRVLFVAAVCTDVALRLVACAANFVRRAARRHTAWIWAQPGSFARRRCALAPCNEYRVAGLRPVRVVPGL